MSHVSKFLHTIGSVGLLGAMVSLLAILTILPDPSTDLAAYNALRQAMLVIGNFIFFPAMLITLLAGLAAMAINRHYQSVGWVWAKLASGFIVFEGALVAIHGPIRKEAVLSAQAVADPDVINRLGTMVHQEWWSLWLLGLVAVANIIVGIWRPRFKQTRQPQRGSVAASAPGNVQS